MMTTLWEELAPILETNNGPVAKAEKDREEIPDVGTAYLGPKLWEKEDFFVMNFAEFLAENNLDLDLDGKESETGPVPEKPGSVSGVSPGTISGVSPPRSDLPPAPPALTRPSIIVTNRGAVKRPAPPPQNEFLYQESKRARREREKEESRRRQLETEFAPEDLALATVPGCDFDPSERAFDMEELRPQPIIRKRPKIFVAPGKKDNSYWDARAKNTIAARRSREARRLKENQIALRAAFLEKKNVSLRQDLDDANSALNKQRIEVDILRQKLAKYEQCTLG